MDNPQLKLCKIDKNILMGMRCHVLHELHDLLKHHYRFNEGVHGILGNIPQVKCSECGFGLPCSCLQNLTEKLL